MYAYVAYGLGIRSELGLPELTPQAVPREADPGDVVIRVGSVRPIPSEINAAGAGFWSTAREACHFVDTVGAFLARDGREIVVDPAPGVEQRVLRLSILGPALGLILFQRGFLVLHASVVGRQGRALAILGNNGWGKSTVAAALHAKGYDLVADDVAAIAIGDDGPGVLPGFPQVKLWPEAAALLGETPEDLPLLHPGFDKRAWPAARGFSLEVRRLDRLYVLAAGSAPSIEPLEPRDACLELLAHWYGHRFGGGLLRSEAAGSHLRQCATLAGQVPMYRLWRSGGSKALLELADLVDQNVGRAAGAPRSSREETSSSR